jgi:AAA+ ATPase superfamily predicted ATPase
MHRNVNDFDKQKLLSSLAQLAYAMECTPLAKNDAESLVDYVMGRGKNGWSGYLRGIITERELRNLIMAHGATTTARSNSIEEPNCDTYMSQELCLEFEIALFGRRCELHDIDYRDSRE